MVPADRDTEQYDFYRRWNQLGRWISYEINCPSPGYDEQIRTWEELTDRNLEEGLAEPELPVDENGLSLSYECYGVKVKSLFAR